MWQLQLEQCVKGPCDRKWHTHDTMRSLSVLQAQASHTLKHKNNQNYMYIANDASMTQRCREDSTMAPDQRRRMGGVIGTVVLVLVLQCGLLRPSHAMVPTIEAYVVYAPAFSVAVSSLDSHTSTTARPSCCNRCLLDNARPGYTLYFLPHTVAHDTALALGKG